MLSARALMRQLSCGCDCSFASLLNSARAPASTLRHFASPARVSARREDSISGNLGQSQQQQAVALRLRQLAEAQPGLNDAGVTILQGPADAAPSASRTLDPAANSRPAVNWVSDAEEVTSTSERIPTSDSNSPAWHRSSPAGPVIDDGDHPLRAKSIPMLTLRILAKLQSAGHHCYVVGGAVRDLLLGHVPKDYDVLTTATPTQVKKLFKRAFIVGKRYPIVHVCDGPVIHEVSSFHTNTSARFIPQDILSVMGDKQVGKRPSDTTWSAARRENAQARDFTVNGLLFDPFSGILYDYVGGVSDCRTRVLRTVGVPTERFEDDAGRILRAVRLAGRAGLTLDSATSKAVEQLGSTIGDLAPGRAAMELHAMLAYGAAEASMRLLWRLHLADLILPEHAAYLSKRKSARRPRIPRSEPLYEALARLDSLVTPAAPVDASVWMAALAAPLIAENLAENPIPASAPTAFRSASSIDGSLDDDDDDGDESSARFGDESSTSTSDEGILDDLGGIGKGTEKVTLNRRERRELAKQQRARQRKEGGGEAKQFKEVAAAVQGEVVMSAPLLEEIRRVVGQLTHPVPNPQGGAPMSVMPKTMHSRTIKLLVHAHCRSSADLEPVQPPEVVIRDGKGSKAGRPKIKKMSDSSIVAHVLEAPGLRWRQLTGS